MPQQLITGNEITSPLSLTGNTAISNLAYSGTFTGSTGVLNIGSGQIYKDSSGNVGIGTSSPTAPLTLVGNYIRHYNNVTRYFSHLADGTTIAEQGIGSMTGDTSSYGFTTRGLYPLLFGTNNTERMRIDSSGNVGIGTTSPGARIHVDSSTSSDQIRISNGAGATVYYRLGRNTSTGYLDFYGSQSGYSGYVFGGVDGERMRISSSGDVGIGMSPGFRLDVSNTTRSGSSVTQSAPSSTDITANSTLLLSGMGGNYLAFGQYGSGQNYAQWIQSCYMNPSTATYNLVLQPLGGNVGIGTSTINNRLTVSATTNYSDTYGIIQAYNTNTTASDNASITVKNYSGTGQFMQWENRGMRIGSRILTNTGIGSVYFTYGNDNIGMVLDSSGRLLVGGTTSIASSLVQSIGTSVYKYLLRDTGATAGYYWRLDADTNNSVIIYNHNNAGVWIGNGGTAWNASSDIRLKNIIEPISNALDSVATLRTVKYSWKSDPDNTVKVGLIAQDVQKVLPEVVSEDPNGNLSVAYTEVIPLLVAAINELTAKVNDLESKIK